MLLMHNTAERRRKGTFYDMRAHKVCYYVIACASVSAHQQRLTTRYNRGASALALLSGADYAQLYSW
jgi:hypothetical protein